MLSIYHAYGLSIWKNRICCEWYAYDRAYGIRVGGFFSYIFWGNVVKYHYVFVKFFDERFCDILPTFFDKTKNFLLVAITNFIPITDLKAFSVKIFVYLIMVSLLSLTKNRLTNHRIWASYLWVYPYSCPNYCLLTKWIVYINDNVFGLTIILFLFLHEKLI